MTILSYYIVFMVKITGLHRRKKGIGYKGHRGAGVLKIS